MARRPILQRSGITMAGLLSATIGIAAAQTQPVATSITAMTHAINLKVSFEAGAASKSLPLDYIYSE